MVVVDLPFAQDASGQLQDLIDHEVGPGMYLVKRTQLITGSPAGYRFQAIVEELAREPALAGKE